MKKAFVMLGTLFVLMFGAQTSFAACGCGCLEEIKPCCPVSQACCDPCDCDPCCDPCEPCCDPCPACPVDSCCDNCCDSCCDCGCKCPEKCSWWKFWQNKDCCYKCDKCNKCDCCRD